MRRRGIAGILLSLVMVASFTSLSAVVNPSPAAADSCYTWNRTLREGMSGGDVAQLQIRVGGWGGYRNAVAIDGIYGPETRAAVTRFQRAYGLLVDGIAGPQTFRKIYQLQDGDCTPAHFAWSEFDHRCSGFSGGRVGAAKVRRNLLRVMWQLEALRRQLGNNPIIITSGFRPIRCNSGASNSQHLYGNAADVIMSARSLCQIARQARYAGFSGILGPGYPGHHDHVHLDRRVVNNDDGITNRFFWSASRCF